MSPLPPPPEEHKNLYIRYDPSVPITTVYHLPPPGIEPAPATSDFHHGFVVVDRDEAGSILGIQIMGPAARELYTCGTSQITGHLHTQIEQVQVATGPNARVPASQYPDDWRTLTPNEIETSKADLEPVIQWLNDRADR